MDGDGWHQLMGGGSQVTTIEYGIIQSLHPQVHTLTPRQAREAYAAGGLGPFDAIASFSSVEHSGLGRYSDAFNPWGDLQAVARLWCVCKPGGGFLLGVPSMDSDEDVIVWNAHRLYGPFLYSHLTANWDQVWQSELRGGDPMRRSGGRHTIVRQRVRVFRKPEMGA